MKNKKIEAEVEVKKIKKIRLIINNKQIQYKIKENNYG
jgi:hypothetical protein